MKIVMLLVLCVALAAGCGGDGDGPRQSPTAPIMPTTTTPGHNTAPCTATIVLNNGATITVSGSPGSSVVAGNVTINFFQNCNFSETVTTPPPPPAS